MERDKEGPYYYNYTLEKRWKGENSQKTGIVRYGTTTVHFPYYEQDTKCKLSVKKCTDCGCGDGYPSKYVDCGIKEPIPSSLPPKEGNNCELFYKTRKTGKGR